MSNELREYQQQDLIKIRDAFQGGARRVLYQLPTGGGKSFMLAWMLAQRPDQAAWFAVHTKILIDQVHEMFEQFGIPHGIIAGGVKPDPTKAKQIVSVQAVASRVLTAPAFVVFDECHHIVSKSNRNVIQGATRVLGVTATPLRLDGKGLGEVFDTLIEGPTMGELAALGFLSRYKLYGTDNEIDVTGVKTQAGDFAVKPLAEASDKAHLTGDAIEHYQKLSPGRRAVAYCVTVEHATNVSQAFNAAGITAAVLSGDTNNVERRRIVTAFERGGIQVIVNCSVVSEGFDLPAIESVIMLRPTKSIGLYLQMCGRGLRPAPGKEYALILDHAGNTARCGFPDEEREWSLGTKKKRQRESDAVKSKHCPVCQLVLRIAAATCHGCGHAFKPARDQIVTTAGELVELKLEGYLEKYRRRCEAILGGEQMRQKKRVGSRWITVNVSTSPEMTAKAQRGIPRLDELNATASKYGLEPGWIYHQLKEGGLWQE